MIIIVDGWCSGNPGKGGFRGIDKETGIVLFNRGCGCITNNLAEYFGLYYAIKYAFDKGIDKTTTIYSDSETALAWVKYKKVNTKMDLKKQEGLKNEIIKSETWLKETPTYVKIIKWNTKKWGENPADFGRKKRKPMNNGKYKKLIIDINRERTYNLDNFIY